MFIVLLSFSVSLATKCASFNDEPCMIRPTLIDLDSVELKYYPFMISIDQCTGSWNVFTPKICVPKETKDIYVKAFNMITNKNEAKTMTKHNSWNCKCKLNSKCNWNKKWNYITCQCQCRNCHSWNPTTCICENSIYLRSIADTSVIECDEIASAMDIASTKMTNTMAAHVSINCHNKKVKYEIDCNIFQFY